ncbi:MAG TPA: hypothetical protein VFD38_20220, partial [Myxococcaceae bacterium]|nr:hypothetical protein [Myxococcaceae bacterium]
MGRRTVPSEVVRNIELLVGVALPLFLTGVWLQDHLTGSGHWARPIESGFFEWLSLVPLLAFLGLLHSVAVAWVAGLLPRAASRTVVLVLALLMVPLLVLAGRPVEMLARYAVPLLVALAVYALASRIPGTRATPPEDDLRTAPLSEHELLGPRESPTLEAPPAP